MTSTQWLYAIIQNRRKVNLCCENMSRVRLVRATQVMGSVVVLLCAVLCASAGSRIFMSFLLLINDFCNVIINFYRMTRSPILCLT